MKRQFTLSGVMEDNQVLLDNEHILVTADTRDWRGESFRTITRRSRLSVWSDIPETVLDNVDNRTRRPYTEWRKLLTPHLESLNISTAGMRWSQYAFCSCPCSPGFILPDLYRDGRHNCLDFFVTLRGAPNIDPSIPGRLTGVA